MILIYNDSLLWLKDGRTGGLTGKKNNDLFLEQMESRHAESYIDLYEMVQSEDVEVSESNHHAEAVWLDSISFYFIETERDTIRWYVYN
jgi:hypothetical protein